jgi:hypothetical protein
MAVSRGEQKFERITVTLVPTNDERSFQHVPTTFSPTSRRYGWKHFAAGDYMIVPKRIASDEIKVDLFIDLSKKRKMHAPDLHRLVQQLVESKIATEWQGLKLAGIGRVTTATPPHEVVRRGTIEEILGATIGRR